MADGISIDDDNSKYTKLENFYRKLSRRYLKFLPASPTKLIGLDQLILKRKNNVNAKRYHLPDVQSELKFYSENYSDLEIGQTIDDVGFTLTCLKETDMLDGDILELGTYKCGASIMMARFLDRINSKKKIYTCDGFVGLPYDEKNRDNYPKGHFSDTSYEYVTEKLKKFHVHDRVSVIEGLFHESLGRLSEKNFSFILIDCDLYESARQALDFSYPRLVGNGIMMFHDYNIYDDVPLRWGITTAVNEYLDKINKKIIKSPKPHIVKI